MSSEAYSSTDFAAVAFLLCQPDVRLVNVTILTPTRTQFLLAPKTLCDHRVLDFYAGRALVNPKAFHEAGRRLKALLHDVRRAQGV